MAHANPATSCPASDFIPLAESNGAIVPLTWLVFDRIVGAAQGSGTAIPTPFSVAVNVSPQMLTQRSSSRASRLLKAALDEHKMGLTIELTEDSLVQGDASSLASIERVRKLGIDLAIDDFGKGYSSLTYLKQIPAAEIKIDKRFIGTVAVDETDQQIVKTVIALAHALGMRVVAEGVDSAEAIGGDQRARLRDGAGFLHRPADARRPRRRLDRALRAATIRACPSRRSRSLARNGPSCARV